MPQPSLVIVALTFVCGGAAQAAELSIVRLHVQPPTVRLAGANRQQQLLITAETDTGRAVDVTGRCQVAVEDPGLATVDGALVSGLAEGRSQLVVRCAGVETRAALVVEDFASFPPIHFENDLVPLFAKLRCNSSGCHGKQSGQNGFKLSVFGFDPRADYNALVKEARGRRVFPAAPDRSLLFAKATGLLPHGGGRRAAPESPDAQLLWQWIAQGTPWGSDDAPRVAGLQVAPAERVMDMESEQQILVTAVYSDGHRRDVTHAAAYTSNAAGVAGVDERGRIHTGARPGEAAITINYMGQVGVTRVLVPRAGAGFDPRGLPVHNRIDELVWDKLAKLGIQPSETCDDATFLRRLYLTAIGTLPAPDEVRAFLADAAPDKRRQAIDRVLRRDEFADYWALKWADILLVNSDDLGPRGAYEFHRWLRQQVADNRPYDQWVREMLTASGNSGKYGPVNFYRAARTPPDVTKTISQALLGIRLDCAQCHHHPFEKWGQADFYGLAGYFSGLQRKELSPGRELVFHSGGRGAPLPLTGEQVPTRTLDGTPLAPGDGDPRVPLAQWLTARDNPWFARLAANRLWKHFLGRGLVEPEDDLRSTNPPTNEPLLDYLTQQTIEHDFDLQAVMRLILNSRTFQLSSRANETNFDDQQNFSHYLVRRMPAEVLLDAISQVTASPERFPGSPPGTRSIQLWDNRLPSYFLDTFGRSERESPCECGSSSDPTMAQALHLMNAPEIEAKIVDPAGRAARLVRGGAAQAEIVDELCLAALGRPADDGQRAVAADLFAAGPPQQAAQDFLWTLLNSYEFLFIQ